ncbi:protein unc-93 homolog A-like [Styela clava]
MVMDGDEKFGNEKVLRKARKKVKLLFYWKTIGILLAISAVAALQTLQTSINIEDDIGAIALTAGYVASIFFSLLCVPALLRLSGPNVALVVGDICFLIYCLTNFYPELYVLTFGAVISGIARSVFFPTYTILVMEIASTCTEFSTSKPEKYYFNYFQSRFYGMLESSSIIGNILSYGILYGTKSAPANTEVSTTQEPNTTQQSNTTWNPTDPYQYCGVDDCQDPTVVSESIDQYVPPDKTSIYILIFSASALTIISILLHAFVYPGLGVFSHKLEKEKDRVTSKTTEQKFESLDSKKKISVISNSIIEELGNDNPDFVFGELELYDDSIDGDTKDPDNLNTYEAQKSMMGESKDIGGKASAETIAVTQSKPSYWKTLKATLYFLIYPRSLMLSMTTLHFGMMLGFVYADLTRAYASCVAGVEMTGLFAMSFGAAGILAALLYGKLNFPHRRHIMYAICCILVLAMYITCYVWDHEPSSTWVLYIIFIGFGAVKGLFRQNIVEAYALHFPDKRDVAFSVYNVWYTGGLAIQYGFSTFMCVEDKLYTQFALYLTSIILFVVVEVVYMRKRDESGSGKHKEEISKTKL